MDKTLEISSVFPTLRENKIILATIFLTTIKFKYLQQILKGFNKSESSTENYKIIYSYYKIIVTATTYVNY